MMMNLRDFRIIFIYEFKLGHNATQATRNVNESFCAHSVHERTVQRWFKKFRSGDMNIENKDHGRPSSTVDEDKIKDLLVTNPRSTVRELAAEMKVSVGAIWNHLKAMGKVKKLDQWIPHELNEKQKNCRFEICSSLLLRNSNEPFLDRIS